MADNRRSAEHGKKGIRARVGRCLAVLLAVAAVVCSQATYAVADNQGIIQNVELAWNPDNNTGAGVELKDDGSIALTPQGPAVNAAGTKASATLSFNVENAMDGKHEDIKAGELEIRLPAHIFYSRGENGAWGDPQGTFSLGLVDDPDKLLEGKTLYYTWDTETDEIVIRNGRDIHDSGTFSVEITWSSTNKAGDPHAVGDDASGARNIATGFENDAIKATSKLNHGGVEETDESGAIAVSYETFSDFVLTKTARDYQFEWDEENWGKNPGGEGDWVYTAWEVVVKQTGRGTQPYTMTVEDLPQSPEGGEVVYNSLDPDSASKKTVSWTVGADSVEEAAPKTFTYVVRYPKPADGKGFYATNKAQATMEPLDYAVEPKEDSDQIHVSSLDFKYPGAGPGIEKSSYETHREGAVNAIRDAEEGAWPAEVQKFQYTNAGSMRGGILTLGRDADGNPLDSGDLANFGKRAYGVELTDDLLVLDGEQLVDDDYEIAQITVGDREESSYEKSAATGGKYASRKMPVDEWCVADPETGENPTADVYIRFGSDPSKGYVRYGTVTYIYDAESAKKGAPLVKSTFEPAPGMEDAYAAATAGTNGKTWYGSRRLPLDLPSGVNGAQIRWSSKNYATRISSVALVNLRATRHVKEIVGGQAKVNLVNVNSLRAFDPDGQWYEPGSDSGAEGDLAPLVSGCDEATYTGAEAGKYAYHAAAQDTLESFVGHTSIHKGGRSDSDGSVADDAASTDVSFSYNAEKGRYEGLYYVDAIDWSATSKTYNGNAEGAVRAKGFVNEQNEGTFYDLLPAGMTVDTSSVSVWKKRLEADESANEGTPAVGKCAQSYAWREQNDEEARYYVHTRVDSTVELVQNWRGSGRTMMIVHVKTKDGKNLLSQRFGISNSDEHYYWYSGFHMEFNAFYTCDDFSDYGSSFTNSVAYMGQSSKDGQAPRLWDGFTDDATGSGIDDADLMGDLDGDGNESASANVVYAQEPTQLNREGESESAPTKRVMDEHDSTWQIDTVTTQGGSYRYRLRMVAASELKDVVVYDDIERHVDDSEYAYRWYGTFAGVDTSHAERLGIAPKVYYSFRDDLDIYTSDTGQGNAGTDRDLTRADVWTPAEDCRPEDLAAVKAVAVDYGTKKDGTPAVINKDQAINTYIEMTAPDDPVLCKQYHDEGARAVNRWIMSSTTASDGAHRLLTIRPVTVRINARAVDFGFTKVDGSALGSREGLSGAEFAVLRWDGEGEVPTGVVDASAPGDGWTKVAEATSGEDGAVVLPGLVKGTYRLIETKAPGGYKLPAGQWRLDVDPALEAGVGDGKQVQIASVAGAKEPPAFEAGRDGSVGLPNYAPFSLPASGAVGIVGLVAAGLGVAAVGLALVKCGKGEE